MIDARKSSMGIFKTFIDKYGDKKQFMGPYHLWIEAMENSVGYSCEEIFKKTKEARLKVIRGEAAYERDSVVFNEIQISWPLLAGLLWIASKGNNSLNLLDFGGSLGSSYYQNRSFLSHLNVLKWNIVEQKPYVDWGKEKLCDSDLQFFNTMEECCSAVMPDTILLSGVLMYLESPYAFLSQVMDKKFKYVLLDRTTFLEEEQDVLMVQKVPLEIFDASYPCWFFSLKKIRDLFLHDYKLIAEFDGFEKADVSGALFKGFIFERILRTGE